MAYQTLVAQYAPDLVVLSNDDGGIVAALKKLSVPTLVLAAPTSVDASYGEYTALGQATGHVTEAAKVAQDVKDRIAKAVASVPASGKGLKVYHEQTQPLLEFYDAQHLLRRVDARDAPAEVARHAIAALSTADQRPTRQGDE